mmetsp:Transcript_58076/g.124773  ORF Transcript_58076/g.124773 Transcript_58076/m.124773 type:complete len:245 (+) Transcript_58076:878-1612(+)
MHGNHLHHGVRHFALLNPMPITLFQRFHSLLLFNMPRMAKDFSAIGALRQRGLGEGARATAFAPVLRVNGQIICTQATPSPRVCLEASLVVFHDGSRECHGLPWIQVALKLRSGLGKAYTICIRHPKGIARTVDAPQRTTFAGHDLPHVIDDVLKGCVWHSCQLSARQLGLGASHHIEAADVVVHLQDPHPFRKILHDGISLAPHARGALQHRDPRLLQTIFVLYKLRGICEDEDALRRNAGLR